MAAAQPHAQIGTGGFHLFGSKTIIMPFFASSRFNLFETQFGQLLKRARSVGEHFVSYRIQLYADVLGVVGRKQERRQANGTGTEDSGLLDELSTGDHGVG